MLVYVKISMTGDEPPDLQKYAQQRPDFPHQPTDLRQSFDEEQFESYRCLGDHIAQEVFEDAVDRVRPRFWRPADPRQEFAQGNRLLFSALQARWAGAARDRTTSATSSRRRRLDRSSSATSAATRTSPRLSRELYPELPPSGPRRAPADPARTDPDRAESCTPSARCSRSWKTPGSSWA